MKRGKNILNVDVIGGQGSLTTIEEKALAEHFKKRKETFKKQSLKASGNLQKKLPAAH